MWLVAPLLAVSVLAWWQLVPGTVFGGSARSGGQLATVAALTLVPAVLAATVGLWVGRRRRWPGRTTSGMLSRAAVTAGAFAVLLLALAPAYQAIDTVPGTAATTEARLAEVRYDASCPPGATAAQCAEFEQAGIGPAAVEQAHDTMMHHTGHSPAAYVAIKGTGGEAAEDDLGTAAAAYAIQDGLVAALVVLPVALLGMYLVARFLPARRPAARHRLANGLTRIRSRRLAIVATGALVVTGNLVFAPVATAQQVPPPFSVPMPIMPEITDPNPTITMEQADIQVLPDGPATTMWTYDGMFPGPTIRRPSGETTRVTFVNDLPVEFGEATVHHHGNHSESSEDGQPDDALVPDVLIPPGGQRTYTYEHVEDGEPEWAAPQWYHDHRMDVTGRNVWNGLAGMYILEDDVESALPLPDGDFEVPMVVVDRTFDENNQIMPYVFDLGGTRGDTVLVNGAPQPFFEVGDRKYRFRVLNASNTREYTMQLSNGQPMTQIGTDSGLLPEPVTQNTVRILPAERVDLVVDFAGQLGEEIVLQNVEPGAGSTAQMMQFRVTEQIPDDSEVPDTLRPAREFPEPTVERDFELALDGALWTINGQGFDPERVDAEPVLGSTERWTFRNNSPLPHAIHIHDVDWQLDRRFLLDADGQPGDPLPIPPGEDAAKETWQIQPGEGFSVLTTFTDHTGVYMFHCHILEHEDLAMMSQFAVQPAGPVGAAAEGTPNPIPMGQIRVVDPADRTQ
ncbi:MAG: multicopper oxidase family protein [Natronosporangium sp.]